MFFLPELLTKTWHHIEKYLPLSGGIVRPAPPPAQWLYYWKWKGVTSAAELEAALNNKECMDLEAIGPETLEFTVTQTALVWTPYDYRWHTFLTEPTLTERARNVCMYLAHQLGANHVLYLPDSGYPVSRAHEMMCYEGKTVAEAEEWLHQAYGAPVPNILTLLINDEPARDRYFMDFV